MRAYEGPAGLARLNQILQLAALTAGEPHNRCETKTAFLSLPFTKQKGSEFDYVFLAGHNEGTFPSPFALAEGRHEQKSACSMWPSPDLNKN